MAPTLPGGPAGGFRPEAEEWGECRAPNCSYGATGTKGSGVAHYHLESWPSEADNCSPEPIHVPFTMGFLLATIVATLWGALQTLVALGKIVLTIGTVDYVKYMTNWSWSWQAVFFDLVAITSWYSIYKEIRARRGHHAPTADLALRMVLENLLLTTVILDFGVFFGLRVVLWYAPQLLSENFEAYGEGVVYDANFFIHDLPVIPLVVYILFAFKNIRYILRRSPTGLAMILLKSTLFMMLYTGAYCAFFSPTYVYSMGDLLSTAAACAIFAATGFGMAVILVLAISPYADMAIPHPTRTKYVFTGLFDGAKKDTII